MPTTEALQPDEDDEYEDDELPPDFLIFTCPDLDRDEEKARKAGDKIDTSCAAYSTRRVTWSTSNGRCGKPNPPAPEPAAPASNCSVLSAGSTVWSAG